MSKIEDLIQELCPEGVLFLPIGNICRIKTGEPINKNEIAKNPGEYPVINSGKEPLGYLNKFNTENDPLGIASRGSVGIITWNEGRYFRGNLNYSVKVLDSTKYLDRFLYHWLCSNQTKLLELCTFDGIPALNKNNLEKLKVPLLPISIQQQIIGVLDAFTDMHSSLFEEIGIRRKQYDYYRDLLLTFSEDESVARFDLGHICNSITTGKLDVNAKVDGGKYPFFTCDADSYLIDQYAFDTEAILLSGNGSRVGHVNYYAGKFNAYQRTYVLSDFSDSLNVQYLLHYLNAYFREYVTLNSRKGSVPYITMPMLKSFSVPLPNLDIQNQIVGTLDQFEEITNSHKLGLPAELIARRKQYEYYRDKLLTFKELAA